MRKTILIIVTALLLCSALPIDAHAASLIDTSRSCSLTLIYEYDGQAFPMQRVSLYRVAAVSEDGQYTTLGDFAPCPVDPDMDREELTETLLSYVAIHNMVPDLSAVTDVNGTVVFDRLPTGLYLVTPVDTDTADFIGFTLTLPEQTESTRNYNVTALPKGQTPGTCDVPQTGDKTVAYLWAGALWFSGLGLVWSAVLLRRRDL